MAGTEDKQTEEKEFSDKDFKQLIFEIHYFKDLLYKIIQMIDTDFPKHKDRSQIEKIEMMRDLNYFKSKFDFLVKSKDHTGELFWFFYAMIKKKSFNDERYVDAITRYQVTQS